MKRKTKAQLFDQTKLEVKEEAELGELGLEGCNRAYTSLLDQ